ncbi:peroxidase-like [Cimex lectularius]|uniref:Chorion peroxidase n=1 Tax=Cimex lectularius TaxID=79782 RepID=A0A8I6R908_CIMLE|nr:peroxidase-like [Cimex lectularius]
MWHILLLHLTFFCLSGSGQNAQAHVDLLPEQLEQQKVQFRQSQLHSELQQIQHASQVSSGDALLRLQQQSSDIQSEIERLQQEMLRLQRDLQRRLNGEIFQFQPVFVEPLQNIQNESENPKKVEEDEGARVQVANRELVCQTATGVSGLCRPLVNCLAFYTDLPELRKQPCSLGKEELGVCCPAKNRPAPLGPKSSGVLHSPPPPNVPIPPLTPRQLNDAGQVALQAVKERLSFLHELFTKRIIVRPGSAAASHQEFFPTTNQTLAIGDEAQKSIEASTALVNEFHLSPDQGTFALPSFSLLSTVLADTCPRFSNCIATKYRTMDGTCNNLARPDWGMAGTALQRILPPKYADGVNLPRTLGSDGVLLPSARLLSTRFAQDADRSSDNYTMMVMQWGQFLDHDLAHTPISRGEGGSGISCCRDGKLIPEQFRHPDCFPIELPRRDHIFAPFGDRCMEFSRSLPAPRPECNFGPREQMNQITGYLDGSNIYGSNDNTARSLRTFRGGQLRIQNIRGRTLLPDNPGECTDQSNTVACFRAGDGRVNEQVDLALVHTVWLREHNRIANILSQVNPQWSDEALYQEARRIVIAEIQHITYNEFLPIILGRDYMDRSSLSPKDRGWANLYDPNLNGGITNVFATAAFRYGHSQIQSFLHGYSRFGNLRANIELSKQHFAPFMLYREGVMDDLLRGLSAQASQNVDRFFSNQLTDHLFQGDLDIGLDLVALNIQRGRDHGLPPYNDWREVCGLPRARTWADLARDMDPQTVRILSNLYTNVNEIDLFIGAVAEHHKEGAILGPTLVCLVGDQFARLRRADRFFYEEGNQPSSFSAKQLSEIKKTSLARIICDNSDNIALMQPLVFIQPSFLNQRVGCQSPSIPVVDLRAWRDERPAVN